MKKLLALALVAMMAGGAVAQEFGDLGGAMGMFFHATDYTDVNTNKDDTAAPFSAYVVLMGCPVSTIGGYELGITMSPSVFVLGVTGENGWTNFGDSLNQLAGYQVPLNVGLNGTVVLATMNLLYTGADPIDISFGPSTPSSFAPGGNIYGVLWDGPGVADGANADLLYVCQLTSGLADEVGVVATLKGTGVTATEERTLSSVKALFE